MRRYSKIEFFKGDNMNVLSLFNGACGFNLASELAGIKTDKIYTSEVDKYCLAVEKHRYPNNIHRRTCLGLGPNPYSRAAA